MYKERVPDILKILDDEGLSWCQHCSMLDLLFLVQREPVLINNFEEERASFYQYNGSPGL